MRPAVVVQYRPKNGSFKKFEEQLASGASRVRSRAFGLCTSLEVPGRLKPGAYGRHSISSRR
jgi:hypothetical protein